MRLNLFNNSPLSIPHQILIREHVFSDYDHKTQTISYKESMEATENLSQMKVRSYFDQHLEMQHDNSYEDIDEKLVVAAELNEEDYVTKEDGKKKKVKRQYLFTDEDIL